MRRLSFSFLATAVTLVLLCAAGCAVHAQSMTLVRETEIVAGIPGAIGSVDGYPGTSTFFNPTGLCNSPFHLLNGNTPTTAVSVRYANLLVGSTNYFRVFNRSNSYLGKWFGRAPLSNEPDNSDGPIATATVSGAFSCTSGTVASASTNYAITYYVVGSSDVRWVVQDVVYSYTVDATAQFSALAWSGTYLYLLHQSESAVHRCDVGDSAATNFAPYNCVRVSLDLGNWLTDPSQRARGIAASSTGIFIATGAALNYYSAFSFTLVASIDTIPFVDVRFGASNTNELYAASWTALYSISIGVNTITATVIEGTESGNLDCIPSINNNVDGASPTFCGIFRIFPISIDAIYITNAVASTLRELLLPPVVVPYVFVRRPFPIGFVGEEYIMPSLYTLMDTNVNSHLATTTDDRVTVDTTTGYVDSTNWDTNFTLDVPQRAYDITATRPAIASTNFSDVLAALDVYYNRTNEFIYGDRNLLPTCNRTKMFAIERRVGEGARTALGYPLIYTDPTATMTINDNPNITATKLLMPASFGYGEIDYNLYNETTHPALTRTDFNTLFLDVMPTVYEPDRQYLVSLPEQPYNFTGLSAERRTAARWIVLDIINKRLKECALANGDTGDHLYNWSDYNSDSSNSFWDAAVEDLYPNCVSQVGLTNETQVLRPGYTGSFTEYDVYVPEDFDYSFNISQCLDGTDWSPLERYLNSTTVSRSTTKCGTGCIVGIAVAAAVVAAIIIAVIVVLTSKRRRLATVVAAPNQGVFQPKFASTVSQNDTDEYYEVGDETSNQNPLRP